MLLIKCPKCKQEMKYQPSTIILAGKRKRCVYCGKSYKISENVVKKIKE